jgi:twitching motility protein PilT
VDRIIDVFPAAQQAQVRAMFSESIQAVISQVLFKRKDGKGRIAGFEIMIGNPAVRNLIREGKISQIPSIMQTSKGIGMQTMEASVNELLAKNVVTKDEVAFYLSQSAKQR